MEGIFIDSFGNWFGLIISLFPASKLNYGTHLYRSDWVQWKRFAGVNNEPFSRPVRCQNEINELRVAVYNNQLCGCWSPFSPPHLTDFPSIPSPPSPGPICTVQLSVRCQMKPDNVDLNDSVAINDAHRRFAAFNRCLLCSIHWRQVRGVYLRQPFHFFLLWLGQNQIHPVTVSWRRHVMAAVSAHVPGCGQITLRSSHLPFVICALDWQSDG